MPASIDTDADLRPENGHCEDVFHWLYLSSLFKFKHITDKSIKVLCLLFPKEVCIQ